MKRILRGMRIRWSSAQRGVKRIGLINVGRALGFAASDVKIKGTDDWDRSFRVNLVLSVPR